MTASTGAANQPPAAADQRASFVRRSLAVALGMPALGLLLLFLPPGPLSETALVLLLLAGPWVLCVLAWQYAGRYAHARGVWRALAALLASLGLALLAGAAYLFLLGSAFGRA